MFSLDAQALSINTGLFKQCSDIPAPTAVNHISVVYVHTSACSIIFCLHGAHVHTGCDNAIYSIYLVLPCK